RFLVHMHEFMYACQHRTFLGNCENGRKDLAVARRKKALRTHFDSHAEDYRNPFYESSLSIMIFSVSTRSANIEVFAQFHSRWGGDGILPRESSEDAMVTLFNQIAVLQSTIAVMETRVGKGR
ncbi:hypothetical protein PMAYCL1PPCAC_10373, partial [Pristionchus mayeri]